VQAEEDMRKHRIGAVLTAIRLETSKQPEHWLIATTGRVVASITDEINHRGEELREIKYRLSSGANFFSEEDVFKTVDEACSECAKRDKEILYNMSSNTPQTD
jgi:hypothetical protein